MTIIEKFNSFLKKKISFFSNLSAKSLGIQKFNPFVFIAYLVVFSGVFLISSNLISNKSEKDLLNFKETTSTNEFSNFKNFLSSKISSPYEEKSYVIQDKDTIEKILKKFNVKSGDIKNISIKLKQKNLTNIYSGKKLLLILKKN